MSQLFNEIKHLIVGPQRGREVIEHDSLNEEHKGLEEGDVVVDTSAFLYGVADNRWGDWERGKDCGKAR